MLLMTICGAMLALALVLAVRWSSLAFEPPPPADPPSAFETTRRYAWWCSLLVLGGISAGLLVIGAGGRLAMRLLAVTAGDVAQGRVTEADQVVGEITVGGTVGFVLFGGIFGGLITSALYLLVRRLLPPRWVGGLCFGAGFLVIFGTTQDPLRQENPDFDVVGPGWLSVLVFVALALAYGVVLASFTARLSTWLPLPSMERAVVLRYVPVAFYAVLGFTFTALLVLVGVFVVAVAMWRAPGRWVRSSAFRSVGRIALIGVVLLALPAAVQSMADIAGR